MTEQVPRHADVVIVGGGPAGAVAALQLARGGMHVVLLERCALPRAKACGDCLSPQATLVLERLGLLPDVLALEPATLAGWRICAPDGSAFEGRFDEIAQDAPVPAALAIRREAFDAVLLTAAARAGAEIVTRTTVTDLLHSNGAVNGVRYRTANGPGTVRSALVIGADGLRSIVARRLGLIARPARLRKASITVHVRGVRELTELGEMHLAPGFCLGVAPLGGGLCNLTLVAAGKRARALAGADFATIRAATSLFPALRLQLKDAVAEPEADRPGALGSGPFDVPVRKPGVDGVMLAGDAAGYYDPFTGQGIHRALVSAEALAVAALNALHARDTAARALQDYAREQHRLLRETMALQRAIEAATSAPPMATTFVRWAARNAPLRAALLAVTGDLMPPAALFSPRRVGAIARAALESTR